MENRIPIDELFHDTLSQGREQINLGAWANMERMLNGKNPYVNEDKKKRRGFLPFLLLLLVSSGIAGTAYLISSSNKIKPSQTRNLSSLANTSKPIETNEIVSSQNDPSNLFESSKGNNTIVKELTSTNNNTTTTTGNEKKSIQNNGKSHQAVEQKVTNSSLGLTNLGQDKEADKATSALNTSNAVLTTDNLGENSTDKKSSNRKSSNKKSSQKESSNKNLLASSMGSSSELDAKNSLPALPQQESSIKTKEVKESMPMVTINQKTLRNRDGSVKRVLDDTISKSVFEKVTVIPINEPVTASVHPTVPNPRFRKLSEEEEKNVNLRKSNEPKDLSTIASATPPSTSASSNSSSSSEMSSTDSKSDIALRQTQKSKVVKQVGYLESIRKYFLDTYNKISNFVISAPKPDVYTGLNMGLNTSLSSSKNNFGGFQGGFVMLRPINDYFSFVTECKFFYRNNGGYTANDISTKVINKDENTTSIAHSTIYSYQLDSTIKSYNFKNFYSLEMPLMAQLNIRKFGLYGGVNIAYNFKLKTTEKTRNYAPEYRDTILSIAAYSWPVEKASQYSRSDFSSRFGLGYTLGMSYNFTPQLYFDFRLTQNVWDNMKTNAAREISNSFFKVPSIQLGLGYRFRKFSADN